MAEKYAEVDLFQFESTRITQRSVEYCSYVLEAVTTGVPFRFMGNVRNDGYITNLPAGCYVEVPTFADATGLHPTVVGNLPVQCAALCQTNINVQTLCAEAALTGDPEYLVHAMALDPLTVAVLPLYEIRRLTSEMLETLRPYLLQFAGRTLRRTPTIHIAPDVIPVDVPLDPALAIGKRFGMLISQETKGQKTKERVKSQDASEK